MRLSASLFPADAALANRGGVPLGAVVHPFRARRVADDDEDDGGALFSSTSVRKQPGAVRDVRRVRERFFVS